jgi:hypothetical protein
MDIKTEIVIFISFKFLPPLEIFLKSLKKLKDNLKDRILTNKKLFMEIVNI